MTPTRHSIREGRQLITISPDRLPEIEFLYYRSYLSHTSPIAIRSEDIASLSSEGVQIDVVEEEARPLADWPTIVDIILTFLGFAGASVAAGFFGQIGSDIYTKLKERIKQIAPNRNDDRGRLIRRGVHVVFHLKIKGRSVIVQVAVRVDQLDLLGTEPYTFSTMLNSVKSFVNKNDVVEVLIAFSESDPYWTIVHFKNSNGQYYKRL